jgi:hypothetical protein
LVIVRDVTGEMPLVLQRFNGRIGFGCKDTSLSVCIWEPTAGAPLEHGMVDRDVYFWLELREIERFGFVQRVLLRCPECANRTVYALFPQKFEDQFAAWLALQLTQPLQDGKPWITLRANHKAPAGFEVVNPRETQE